MKLIFQVAAGVVLGLIAHTLVVAFFLVPFARWLAFVGTGVGI